MGIVSPLWIHAMPSPPETRQDVLIRRGRARPSVRRGAGLSLAAWGVLLLAGGIATWSSIPRGAASIPEMWNPTIVSADASSQMTSVLRQLPSGAAPLLRLEWPEHPGAVEYRIRFRSGEGPTPPALAVQSPVFLYDLQSNVLRLPAEFQWEVAAVLRDGSEVVSPWRSYPRP